MDMKNSGEKTPWMFSLKLGRRKNDPILKVDFKKERVFIRYPILLVEHQGVFLEGIAPGPWGKKEGIILAQKSWKRIYFVNERSEWKEDDYFLHANILIRELGISDEETTLS